MEETLKEELSRKLLLSMSILGNTHPITVRISQKLDKIIAEEQRELNNK